MVIWVKREREEKKGGRNDNKNDGGGSGVEWKRGKIVNYGKEKFKKEKTKIEKSKNKINKKRIFEYTEKAKFRKRIGNITVNILLIHPATWPPNPGPGVGERRKFSCITGPRITVQPMVLDLCAVLSDVPRYLSRTQ